ncbi:MAG: ArgE/DapE family deacylase [Candidatus Hinthialibacter antarcticus]|nr:ArgE/DapE family deacylase [Candidatus Hinthialibacter antarcticus]
MNLKPLTTRTDGMLKYLKERRSGIIDLTQAICSFPTENPPGRDFKACAGFLKDVVEDMGMNVRMLRVPNAYQEKYAPKETLGYPRYNVIALWDVGADRTLHFNSHYDVVPASPNWKTDPFRPVLKSTRLYGRGTEDMKGCLAASIFAVKAIQAEGVQPPWNIELSFTADEEIGGACGVGYLTKEKIVSPDACVVCEGGSGDTVAYGHRGVLWGDVHIRGVAAHGSNPASGVNAFEHGVKLAESFRELHAQHQQRKTNEMMNNAAAKHPTLTLGGVSGGGSKVNIIPDSFHFTFDRRLLAEEDVKELSNEYDALLQSAIKRDKNLDASINYTMAFNAGYTDPKHPFCKIAQKAASTVYGSRAKLRMFGAFTDLHFFTNYANCPAIGYGVEGAGLHGDKEHCDVNSLVKTARVYAEIAMNMP